LTILEAADALGLAVRPAGSEYRACCPFCGDTKFHLYLNPQKDAWHCFRCGEGGGVRDLLQKLGRSPGERPRAPHPVFRLTQDDMRAAGFRGAVDWRALFGRDPRYARACADWVWRAWCEYERRRAQAQVVLLRALESRKGERKNGLEERSRAGGVSGEPGPRPGAEGDAGRTGGSEVASCCWPVMA